MFHCNNERLATVWTLLCILEGGVAHRKNCSLSRRSWMLVMWHIVESSQSTQGSVRDGTQYKAIEDDDMIRCRPQK